MGIARDVWQELEPDIRIPRLEKLLYALGNLPVFGRKWELFCQLHRIVMHAEDTAPIIVAASCLQDVYSHVGSSQKEMGGLLVGQAYELPKRTAHGYGFLTIVSDAIPSLVYTHSPTSLWMGPDLWSQAHSRIRVGKLVLGWYHSHPGIGLFFSGIDRSTQASFFAHSHCLGLVVDPTAHDEKLFFGAGCTETRFAVIAGGEKLLAAVSRPE